jgi:hypothetical protein
MRSLRRITLLLVLPSVLLALAGAAHAGARPARSAQVRVTTATPLGVTQPLRRIARIHGVRHALTATIGGTNVNGLASTGTDNFTIRLATAVGKTQVLESAEDQLMICTKATGTCGSAFPAINLFSSLNGPDCTSTSGSFGATVAYDSLADRYVVVVEVTAPNGDQGYCVAVSQTSDAGGAYNVAFATSFPDTIGFTAPVVGVWPNGYYISGIGQDIVTVVQRSWFLTTQTCCPQVAEFSTQDPTGAAKPDFLPMNVTGTTAPPSSEDELLFTTHGDEINDNETEKFDGLWAVPIHVDWANPGADHLGSITTLNYSSQPEVPCFTYPEGFCIGEPNGGQDLDSDHGSLYAAPSYRDRSGTQSVVLAHDVDVLPYHDYGTPAHAGVWWHSLSINSSGVPSLTSNDGQYVPDGSNYFAGSAAYDRSGDIGLAYSVSSTSVSPSVRFTGRLASDAAGQMTQGQSTAVTSSTVNTQCCAEPQDAWSRNALSIDPDGCTFWNAGLFMASNSLWASRITNFALPGCNLALSKTATSSSNENSSLGPANAVDGNTSTRWSSAFSDPQWLRVDLGSSMAVKKVVLRWESAYAKSFQIQVSNNGTSWTTIYTTTAGTGGTQTLTGLNGTGRYVRMYGTQRATQYGYSLYEMEVYSG